MESKSLLQYIKDAITQETDILQQERVIAKYDELQRERKPVLITETKPQEPTVKEYDQPLLALILTIILAVAGLQIFQNIKKLPVGHLARFAVKHHKAGMIPLFKRGPGDQFLRQIIVKITGFHSNFSIIFKSNIV